MSSLGDVLLSEVRGRFGGGWNDIEEQAKVEEVLSDYSRLLLAGVAGEDVGQAMAELEATLANWAWVGSDRARRVVLDVLTEAATLAGEFLTGVALRLAQ